MVMATEPRCLPSFRPTRRALLAGAASTPVLALPAIAAVAAGDLDPHVAWAAEVDGLRPIMRAADDDTADGLAGRICELHELIVDTPARTVAGLREQARVLHGLLDADDNWSLDAVGLRNMLTTLERLAGEARHV